MKRNCAHRSFSEFSIGTRKYKPILAFQLECRTEGERFAVLNILALIEYDIFEFVRRKQVDVVAHHAIRCEYQLETSEELPGMIGGHDDATVIFNH